jgi:hypothetical protein
MSPAGIPLQSAGNVVRLVNGRRLRGMLLSLRHDIRQYNPPATAEEELVDVTANSFESVDDASERLRRLEDLLIERGDRRSIFLTIYTRMTERIRARIDRGGFENPDSVPHKAC